MKLRSTRQSDRLSAAIAAAFVCAGVGSASFAQTRSLVWDVDPGTAGVQDGSAGWDTSTPGWLYNDGVNPPSNVAWVSANPDSATFGNGTTPFAALATPNTVELVSNLTVQNLTLGTGTNGGIYNISDFSGGSLTINGNITKISGGGQSQFLLVSNALTLAAGDHVVAMKDSPGDVAELSVNGVVAGPGGLTIDNTAATTEAWGTLAFNVDNTYTGATNINNGRLVITTAGGLGATSAGTTISDRGALSIGGAGTSVAGDINITEPITIKRDTYSGGEFGRYNAALIFANAGPARTHTITAPVTVDSADARISVNTNTLVLPGGLFNFTPAAVAANGVVSFTGDFAGFVKLQGSNPQFAANGIKLVNGVEVSFETEDSLGGTTAPITFAGDATLDLTGHPTFTTFGAHPINTASFGGGLNVPAGQSFTLDRAITGGNGLGKRGAGGLIINSPITGTGNIFWDGGNIDVNAAVSFGSLSLRSPVVNIPTGGSLTMTSTTNDFSFGSSATGTNGGPDIAVVNLTGTGSLTQTQVNRNLYLSDGPNTKGTINISDNATFTTSGLLHVARSTGGEGTINQNGGTFTLNRTGDFTLVLGSRRGTGRYNLSAGTMTSAGEFFVGQGLGAGNTTEFGTGFFTMTGGTVNQNNWFVIGREGGKGTVDISGNSVFNKTGGGNVPIGESQQDNSFTLRDSAKFFVNGEVWVANGGGNKAAAILKDNSVFTVNNWFVVGRGGAFGTLDMSGNASLTKSGGGNAFVGESTNNVTSTMTLRNNAVFNDTAGEFWVGQGGGIGILNVQDSASFTTNNWLALGRANGNSKGTINLSGGTLTKQGDNFLAIGSGGQGTLNQTGGTLNSNGTYIGEASNGTANLSGGTSNFTGQFHVGHNGGVFGTLNVSGAANVNVASDVIFGNNGGTGGGTINLDGGTLTANSFAGGAGTGAKVFNFNGGTLKAGADTATFMGGLTSANVKAGGAIIDSNTHNVTITQPLLAGTPSGGLTKQGAGTLTLAAANTYTGGTTVSAGTLSAAHGDAFAGGALNVGNGAIGAITPSTAKAVTLTTLNTNTSGKFDVTTNSMVIKGMADAAVRTQLQAGYNAGAWNGPTGIVSTSITPETSVGYATQAQTGITDFKGVTGLAGTDVLVKYTYAGDANLDGKVDIGDLGLLAGAWQAASGKVWFDGDFTYDGAVDIGDLGLLSGNWQKGTAGNPNPPLMDFSTAMAQFSAFDGVVVPEPASLSLLALGGLALGARRRRRGA